MSLGVKSTCPCVLKRLVHAVSSAGTGGTGRSDSLGFVLVHDSSGVDPTPLVTTLIAYMLAGPEGVHVRPCDIDLITRDAHTTPVRGLKKLKDDSQSAMDLLLRRAARLPFKAIAEAVRFTPLQAGLPRHQAADDIPQALVVDSYFVPPESPDSCSAGATVLTTTV